MAVMLHRCIMFFATPPLLGIVDAPLVASSHTMPFANTSSLLVIIGASFVTALLHLWNNDAMDDFVELHFDFQIYSSLFRWLDEPPRIDALISRSNSNAFFRKFAIMSKRDIRLEFVE